jgi:hypothetical protein
MAAEQANIIIPVALSAYRVVDGHEATAVAYILAQIHVARRHISARGVRSGARRSDGFAVVPENIAAVIEENYRARGTWIGSSFGDGHRRNARRQEESPESGLRDVGGIGCTP